MPDISLQPCPIDASYDPSVEPDLNWIWNGYLAPGDITLLTSQWKAGKTTLLTGLLRSLAGGVPFLDRPTRRAKVLLVSEESRSQWGERVRAGPIGDHVRWLSRPFFGRPSLQEWNQLIAFAMAQYLDLFVIDPLATFLPGRNESDAATMLEALQPLRQLAGDDCAVLLLHHPKKKGGEIGSSARGSGALLGFVDTSLELRRPSHLAADSQCRTLYGQSRRSGTPARLAYEWNRADGAFEVLPAPPRGNSTRAGESSGRF